MFIINEYGYLKRLRLLFYPPRSSPLCVHEDVGQYTIESRPGQIITSDGQARYHSIDVQLSSTRVSAVTSTPSPFTNVDFRESTVEPSSQASHPVLSNMTPHSRESSFRESIPPCSRESTPLLDPPSGGEGSVSPSGVEGSVSPSGVELVSSSRESTSPCSRESTPSLDPSRGVDGSV